MIWAVLAIIGLAALIVYVIARYLEAHEEITRD